MFAITRSLDLTNVDVFRAKFHVFEALNQRDSSFGVKIKILERIEKMRFYLVDQKPQLVEYLDCKENFDRFCEDFRVKLAEFVKFSQKNISQFKFLEHVKALLACLVCNKSSLNFYELVGQFEYILNPTTVERFHETLKETLKYHRCESAMSREILNKSKALLALCDCRLSLNDLVV